jgi:hypothetical protein
MDLSVTWWNDQIGSYNYIFHKWSTKPKLAKSTASTGLGSVRLHILVNKMLTGTGYYQTSWAALDPLELPAHLDDLPMRFLACSARCSAARRKDAWAMWPGVKKSLIV